MKRPDAMRVPMTVQTDILIPADANGADQGALMKVADGIIQSNGDAIDRFVAGARQQVHLSGRGYMDDDIHLDGMHARYRWNHGQEKLDFEVTPYGGEPRPGQSSETNLDGYVVWVVGEPNYPDPDHSGAPGYPGPYNILFNGYLIEQDFQPLGPCGGYPILFGRTALLCQSYVGDVEKLDPLLQESNIIKPNAVIPPNGWGNYKPGTAPDGSGLDKIQKTLGYWLFDWTNTHNPGNYPPFGFNHSRTQTWKALMEVTGRSPTPQFSKGMYFKASDNSPLKPRGKNGMAVLLSPISPGGQEVKMLSIILGEFYDRGKYRVVSRSWTKGGGNISVNDSPLIFAAGGVSGGFFSGTGMGFDLTPSITKKPRASDDIGNPQTTPQSDMWPAYATNDSAFTPDEQAQIDAWSHQVQALNAAWSNKISIQIAAWEQKWSQDPFKKQLTEAHAVRQFMTNVTDANGKFTMPTIFNSTQDPTGQDRVTLVYTTGTSTTLLYEFFPTQQYRWSWNTDLVSMKPAFPRYGLTGNLPSNVALVDNTGAVNDPINNLPSFGGSLANDGTFMTIKEAFDYATTYILNDAVVQQNAEYNAILATKPPGTPPFPTFGLDINKFHFSNITISGDSWSYQQ